MSDREQKISSFMKRGWVLTDIECPSCGSPLLRKEGKFYCAVCNREALVVDSFDEYIKAMESQTRSELKLRIVNEIRKILEVSNLNMEDIEKLEKLIKILNMASQSSS